MSFPLLLAHWPAALGYVAASAGIFWWLRHTARTDLPSAGRGERPKTATTLFQAAASFFRLASPLLLAAGSVATWGLRIAIGLWHWSDVLVVLGVVAFWPLQEWLLHVCLLHLKPIVVFGVRIDPLVARSHRRHHFEPWDAAGGVTPPFIIWLYLAGLPAVWLPFLPMGPALTGMALYFTLALYYEWVHYLIHTPYVPRTWVYRRLWRNHRLHHYQNEHYWFGVTMLSADWLLRTQPSTASAVHSETCRSLGVGGGAESIDR